MWSSATAFLHTLAGGCVSTADHLQVIGCTQPLLKRTSVAIQSSPDYRFTQCGIYGSPAKFFYCPLTNLLLVSSFYPARLGFSLMCTHPPQTPLISCHLGSPFTCGSPAVFWNCPSFACLRTHCQGPLKSRSLPLPPPLPVYQ